MSVWGGDWWQDEAEQDWSDRPVGMAGNIEAIGFY